MLAAAVGDVVSTSVQRDEDDFSSLQSQDCIEECKRCVTTLSGPWDEPPNLVPMWLRWAMWFIATVVKAYLAWLASRQGRH